MAFLYNKDGVWIHIWRNPETEQKQGQKYLWLPKYKLIKWNKIKNSSVALATSQVKANDL